MTSNIEILDRADSDETRVLLCQLCQLLLSWSWEGVVGYEEIVTEVARAYGYDDITVVMGAQLATIQLEREVTFIKTDIPSVPPLAYTQDLKYLLADIYDSRLSVAEARRALGVIANRNPPNSSLIVWLGVIIVSMSFAVDCVGTWEGVLYAALTATATGICFVAANNVVGFVKIAPMFATFASGVIVMVANRLGWTAAAPGLLLIASTFVFIPGDSISMQAFELAEGRWSAAVDRLFYSIIVLVLLVAGAYLAILVTGTPIGELFPASPGTRFPWWTIYPAHLALAVGITLAFHMDRKHFVPALLLLWSATAIAQVTSIVWGEYVGTFIAAIFGMTASRYLSHKPRSIPLFVLMIPIIFALSPGSHGLRQFETWISGQPISGVTDLSSLAATLFAIAIGMVLGRAISGRWRWLNNWPSSAYRAS